MVNALFSRTFVNAIIALGLLIFYYMAFYPGYLSADSVVMLKYALGVSEQTNWHPAFGVLIFRVLYHLFGSIEAIWLAQIALFVAAGYWLTTTYASKWMSFLAAPAILLFPPITTSVPALWKDVWAVLFVLLCFICYKHYSLKLSKRHGVLCVLFAVLAASVRIDYGVIAFLFVLALSGNGASRSKREAVKKLALAIAGFTVSLGLVQTVANSSVKLHLNPWLTIAMWDIGGIAVQGGDPQLPNYMTDWSEGQSLDLPTLLRERYNCETSDFLVFTKGAPPFNLPGRVQRVNPTEEAQELKSAWWNSIRANVPQYLAHRWCVGKQFLGFPGHRIHYAFPFGMTQNPFGLTYERSALNEQLYVFYKAHAHSWMFRYWVQLALAALMALSIYLLTRKPLLAVVLLLSMLAAASRFMILPASDFRYGLWISMGFVLMTLEFAAALTSFFSHRRRLPAPDAFPASSTG